MVQWRASGLSARVFGEQHGLRASTLHQWSHRLRNAGAAPRSVVRRKRAGVAFAELKVRPRADDDQDDVERTASVIEIVSHSGRVVRVQGKIDRDLLRAVLEVVEAC